jgi:hypothetical protein
MSMIAYKGHYKRGRIVPLDNPLIPEGSEVIITVLEPLAGAMPQTSKANPQLDATRHFCGGIHNCDENVPAV